MFGCLSNIFRTITATITTIVTTIVFICVVCVGIVVVIQIAQNAESERVADELNAGFGMQDNPVPADRSIRFDEGEVRVVQVDRDATRAVMDYSVLNDDPATGAVWTAVRFDVFCNKDACRERELAFWLVDDQENDYDEASFMLYDNKLDDAVQGATMTGWQIFEVPAEATLIAAKVRWGGVTLYQQLPR
jgi:hypothetical protein